MGVVECKLGKILEDDRCSVDFSPIAPVKHVYPHERMNNAPPKVVIRKASEPMTFLSSGAHHVVRHESVKSKTEQTTHDLIREHTEKKGTSHVEHVVREKSPEVREIVVESSKPHQAKPSGFRVVAETKPHNPLLGSKRQCEVVEICHVPVVSANPLSGRRTNPLLKH